MYVALRMVAITLLFLLFLSSSLPTYELIHQHVGLLVLSHSIGGMARLLLIREVSQFPFPSCPRRPLSGFPLPHYLLLSLVRGTKKIGVVPPTR